MWSVSCPNQTFCVAGGDNGRVFTFDGHAWAGKTLTTDNTAMGAVSCPNPTFCVVGDNHGSVYSYRANTS